jgi:hypothetical protein
MDCFAKENYGEECRRKVALLGYFCKKVDTFVVNISRLIEEGAQGGRHRF